MPRSRRFYRGKRQRNRLRSQRVGFEQLEQRHLLAAAPLGATPLDTGEFLLGTVSVTPVFFSSTGQTDPNTQDWSPVTNSQGLDEIDQVMQKLVQGIEWWSDTLDTLGTVHTLDFQFDTTFVEAPFPTRFEPIDRNGDEFTRYVTEFIIAQGYSGAASIEEGMRQFNQQQRDLHGTDWAFTIFVVDASDDQDGMFAPGPGHRGAFAFAGGLFMVVPSTRSAAIFAHEMGHIFWALDEYPFGASWQDHRGYYDTQALNAADNPAFDQPGVDQEISIMRGFSALDQAFAQHVSPASTLAMVGWQDSDGDGIFDVLDVPLALDANGYYDIANSEYHFQGVASAVPLINKNSSGPQSDITLNRISQIQYRLDDGPWTAAATPDQQVAEFDILLPLENSFETIQWRAWDAATGIASEIIAGTPFIPAFAAASVSGLAFVDSDDSGQRDGLEMSLENTTIVIRNLDGSPLFSGRIDANDQADGFLPESIPGASINVMGSNRHTNAGSFLSSDAGNLRVLYHYDPFLNRWSEAWSTDVVLGVEFDQSVGQVSIDVTGIRDGGFGRLEALDADGVLITRATSGSLADGQTETITVSDPAGRIARVRALGHAGTIVALNNLSFGTSDTWVTDPSGAWSFQNLADGQYIVELIPERVIHQFRNPTLQIEVSGGTSEMVMAMADRVDSIRHNSAWPEDVTGAEGVTARDALVIINDLGRNSQRILQPHETDGFDVDVNNDGMVSALDALLVINFLGRANSAGEQSAAGGQIAAQPQSGMLNYTGRVVSVESTEVDRADTDDQGIIDVGLYRSPIDPSRAKKAVLHAQDKAILDLAESNRDHDLRQSADPFNVEFEEPFAGYRV